MGALSDLARGEVFKDMGRASAFGMLGVSHREKQDRKKLAALQAQKPAVVGKASRDQNSSPGATVTRREVPGRYKATNMQARSGHFEGKTRGVGRKEGRDQNSSPKVTRVQPRHPNGRWVSHENDLGIYHPESKTGTRRTDRTSAVMRATKGGDKVSRPWVSKVDVPLGNLLRGATRRVTGTGAGAMKQSSKIKPGYTDTRGLDKMPRIAEPGNTATHAAFDAAATVKGSRASKLYGRANTRFGLTGTRGRRLR